MPRKPPPGWYPQRGEVYVARLDKVRPLLIISVDALNRHALGACVVPLTSVGHRKFTLRVPVRAGDAGLKTNSWAKCDQVTTLEKRHLRYPPLGVLSAAALREVEAKAKLALGLL